LRWLPCALERCEPGGKQKLIGINTGLFLQLQA